MCSDGGCFGGRVNADMNKVPAAAAAAASTQAANAGGINCRFFAGCVALSALVIAMHGIRSELNAKDEATAAGSFFFFYKGNIGKLLPPVPVIMKFWFPPERIIEKITINQPL